jgi:gamma-glutamylcyclotransferase (GGCT)/AIG2-like uncharacterized protein YtfP
MEQTPFLFIYGSLRQGFNNPAFAYISQYFSLIGNATVQGKLVDMGQYPVGVPTTENYTIKGELYKLNNSDEFDWAFEQLDDYEGIHVEANESPLFLRMETKATIQNNETLQCWIYWFNGDVQHKPIIESGDIFDFINSQKK